MGRSLPKLIVLLAIGAVIAAIYFVERRGAQPPQQGVVYVNPSVGTPAAPAP